MLNNRFSKTIIAVFCLHGTITVPTSFLDDISTDKAYHFKQGWGWGLNKAQACGTETNNQECGDVDETILIEYEPPEPIDPDDFPEHGGSESGNDGDDSGSGGNSNSAGKDDPEKDKSACLSSANTFKTVCLGNIAVDAAFVNRQCDNLPLKGLKVRCKSLVVVGTAVGVGVCHTIDEFNRAQCDDLPDL